MVLVSLEQVKGDMCLWDFNKYIDKNDSVPDPLYSMNINVEGNQYTSFAVDENRKRLFLGI